MKTRVTETKHKTNSNRTIFKPEMAYLHVRIRAVRFRFLTILIQRDSSYTQTFF